MRARILATPRGVAVAIYSAVSSYCYIRGIGMPSLAKAGISFTATTRGVANTRIGPPRVWLRSAGVVVRNYNTRRACTVRVTVYSGTSDKGHSE